MNENKKNYLGGKLSECLKKLWRSEENDNFVGYQSLELNMNIACKEIMKKIKENEIEEYYGFSNKNGIIIKKLDKRKVENVIPIPNVLICNEGKQEYVVMYYIISNNKIHDTAISFIAKKQGIGDDIYGAN